LFKQQSQHPPRQQVTRAVDARLLDPGRKVQQPCHVAGLQITEGKQVPALQASGRLLIQPPGQLRHGDIPFLLWGYRLPLAAAAQIPASAPSSTTERIHRIISETPSPL